jgi:hypothetical protein
MGHECKKKEEGVDLLEILDSVFINRKIEDND